MPGQDVDQPLLGQHSFIGVHSPAFGTHEDDDVDVAVMKINGLSHEGPNPLYVKPFPIEYLLNDGPLETLDAIEQVTFIGYPNGIYDSVNMTPIARRGWTATPVSLDYGGQPVFLIDASVFPGSSGSPVLVVNKGSYTHRLGATVAVKYRGVLLGIVSSGYLHETTGKLVPALKLPHVSVKQMMNLGIIYKTRTILETIDQFLASNSLSRAMAA